MKNIETINIIHSKRRKNIRFYKFTAYVILIQLYFHKMAVIGISCFFHDSAAALISEDGEIVAAVQEERFSRYKNDSRFPTCAIQYCLRKSKEINEPITAYIYYEKPIRVFMRLLETYFDTAPRGISSFLPAMKSWISKKIFIKQTLQNEIKRFDENFRDEQLFFSEHHFSHASSAFYPSPFDNAAILCMDAVGEWTTTSGWIGKDNKIKPLWEINFPNSLGLLYSALTYYCGFKVNSGEYKLMGLAPYGEPKYHDLILENLINVKEDGSFEMNMKYFKYQRGLRMISRDFINLFGKEPRKPEEPIDQFYMDVAASIQKVLEGIVLKIALKIKKDTGLNKLCIAGGVGLNCVSNGNLLENSGFEDIWIQPASGDAGGSLGAALGFIYDNKNIKRFKNLKDDNMKSSYLGPSFEDKKVASFLGKMNINFKIYESEEVSQITARNLASGKIVGWFQDRMEFGPRSLGNRSILGERRIKNMQKRMNIKIKNRESFRPFAPAILDGFQEEYFDFKSESPYMLITRNLSKKFLKKTKANFEKFQGIERVNQIRSTLPAITHLDNSCRIQTISNKRNSKFFKLIEDFYKITSCPVLINTSFNVRGQPIVCNPEDALTCFAYTEIDHLVIGNIIIDKKDIPDDVIKKIAKPFLIED